MQRKNSAASDSVGRRRADWLVALWCAAAALALAGGARVWTAAAYVAAAAVGVWSATHAGRYSRGWRLAGRWMMIGAALAAAASVGVASIAGKGWRYGLACASVVIAACIPAELTLAAAKRTRSLLKRLRKLGIYILRERALRVLGSADVMVLDPAHLLVSEAREASAASAPLNAVPLEKLARSPSFIMLMMSCALCSSQPVNGPSNPNDPDSVALRAFAWAYGFDADKLAARYPAVSDPPDWLRAPGTRSERRGQNVRFALHMERNGARLFAQGSPDVLIPLCGQIFDTRPRVMDSADIGRITDRLTGMRASSTVVYAFAVADVQPGLDAMPSLTFVGLVSLTNVVRRDMLNIVETLRVQRIAPTFASEWDAPRLAGLAGYVEPDRMHVSALPEDKARAVAELRKQGQLVAVLGTRPSDAMMARTANACVWLSMPSKITGAVRPDAVVASVELLPRLFEEASRETERRQKPLKRFVWIYHATMLAAAVLCLFAPRFPLEFAWVLPVAHVAAWMVVSGL